MPERLLVRDLAGAPSAILISDGLITALDDNALTAEDAPIISGRGLSAHPGFIDLQVNGIADFDFTSDPTSIRAAGMALVRHGVTSFLPTIVSSPTGTVESAIEALHVEADGGAVPLGLHVEGPYLAPSRAGVHDPGCLRPPDLDEIERWTAAGVQMITLAPELPGGIEAIERIARTATIAAIGHTDADAATTARAIDAGARYATHLFNAMPPLKHSAPGPIGIILADERMTVGVIADGQHVDPVVLGIAARAARGRVSIVSDGVGTRLGGREFEPGNPARTAHGRHAGAAVTLDHGVRVMADLIGADAAIEAVTATPARLLGLDDGRGFLRIGGRADIVLLSDRLEVAVTIVGGRQVPA